jgi:hypothetical protein
MKFPFHSPGIILAVLAASAAFIVPPLSAAEDTHDHDKAAGHPATGQLVPVTAKTDAAWLAKARAAYPMETCSVSGDKFDGGDMGKPQEYIYKEAGKPDQLVRFCCKDCVADFSKDMGKYLEMIDTAAATKAPPAKK